MYDWLRQRCKERSIAELSIGYTIIAVSGVILILLLWGTIISLPGMSNEEAASDVQTKALLLALSLWIVFLVWLWVGLVRTAWKWGHDRLGTPIFKMLQIVFFVMTVFIILPQGGNREDLKLLTALLLAFDVAILIMIINFLSLAWFARCKIPLRAYWEIGSTVTMIIVQIWVFV